MSSKKSTAAKISTLSGMLLEIKRDIGNIKAVTEGEEWKRVLIIAENELSQISKGLSELSHEMREFGTYAEKQRQEEEKYGKR
jgi:RNA polymerase subunit RPABC4/transcription elongation factor Spt4